jgi:hypothetical protein
MITVKTAVRRDLGFPVPEIGVLALTEWPMPDGAALEWPEARIEQYVPPDTGTRDKLYETQRAQTAVRRCGPARGASGIAPFALP